MLIPRAQMEHRAVVALEQARIAREGRKKAATGKPYDATVMPCGCKMADLSCRELAQALADHDRGLKYAGPAADSYKDSSPGVGKWKRLSDAELRAMGLRPGDFRDVSGGYTTGQAVKGDTSSNFHAALYKNPEGEYALAYRGTDNRTAYTRQKDWAETNQQAARGVLPDQYDRAGKLAINVKRSTGGSVTVVGHSQGGGEAAYAAAKHGLPAVAYNSAGLHPAMHTGLTRGQLNRPITNYRVKNEILTTAQEKTGPAMKAGVQGALGPIAGPIIGGQLRSVGSPAVGRQVDLPRINPATGRVDPLAWNPKTSMGQRVDAHGMPYAETGLRRQRAALQHVHDSKCRKNVP